MGSRSIIPWLTKHQDSHDIDNEAMFQRSVQLYELCLHLLDHPDHIVVAQALETFQQVLKTPPKILKQILISPSGIPTSHILLEDGQQTMTATKAASEAGDKFLMSEEDDLDDEVKITDDTTSATTSSLDRGRIKLMDSIDVPSTPTGLNSLEAPEEAGNASEAEVSPVAVVAATPMEVMNDERKIGNVGTFCDKDVPLIFCSRKLAAQFLLLDSKGQLIPDNKVRVSTKALAMGCLTYAVALAPKVFLLTLYTDAVIIVYLFKIDKF